MDYQFYWWGKNEGNVTQNDIDCTDCFKKEKVGLNSKHMNMNFAGDAAHNAQGGNVNSQVATHESPAHGGTGGKGNAHSGLAGGARKVKEGGRNVKQQRRPLQQTMAA